MEGDFTLTITFSRESRGPNAKLDYSLHYDGKQDEQAILSKIGASTELILTARAPGYENAWLNRLYYGDNLGILRALLDDKAVCGQVRLVYIDPPFGTGARFKSRTLEEAYDDELTGSRYLEFIRERLILLRELMAHDGSIYVHLDNTMAFAVKVLMDEIFGPRNFRNWITREKCNRKNYTRKSYGNISDYILFYTKSQKYIWHRPVEEWTLEAIQREYPYVEEETGRRYKKVPLHAPGIRNGETGKPWRGMLPPPGKHWQYPPSVLEELDKRGEIYWSPNGNPRRKIYFDPSKGIPVQDIWLGLKDAHNQNMTITGYPTEKPLPLLERILLASSDPGDLVLDCFCGSGTTLVAAERHGRRWIGIDSHLLAINTSVKRLANGSQRMGDFVTLRKGGSPEQICMNPELRTGFNLYKDVKKQVNQEIVQAWEEVLIDSGYTVSYGEAIVQLNAHLTSSA